MIGLIWAWLSPVTKLFAAARGILIAGAAAAAALFLQRKFADAAEKREANLLAEKVIENHAVAQQESAAETDEDADAALDAADHADRS